MVKVWKSVKYEIHDGDVAGGRLRAENKVQLQSPSAIGRRQWSGWGAASGGVWIEAPADAVGVVELLLRSRTTCGPWAGIVNCPQVRN